MIQLPFEKIIATDINPSLLLIYGMPKIGKTPSLLELEECLLLDFENRARFFNGKYLVVNSLPHLEEIGLAILNQSKPYKYIVIDTVTILEEWCEIPAKQMYLNSPICKKEYKNNPNLLQSVLHLPEGNGYLWLRQAYGQVINFIRTLADRVILIAHVRDKMLVDKNGIEVGSNDLSLTGKIKQITCSKADAIGYLYRKTIGVEDGKPISQMYINFSSSTEILCGSSCAHLRGMDFEFYPEKNPSDWRKIFTDSQPSLGEIK